MAVGWVAHSRMKATSADQGRIVLALQLLQVHEQVISSLSTICSVCLRSFAPFYLALMWFSFMFDHLLHGQDQTDSHNSKPEYDA